MTVLRIRDTSDNSQYAFPLLPNQAGQTGLVIESVPWQEGDPVTTWRIPLHDVSGGYYPSQHERLDTHAADSHFTVGFDGTLGRAYQWTDKTSEHPNFVPEPWYVSAVSCYNRTYIWSLDKLYDTYNKVNVTTGLPYGGIRSVVVFNGALYIFSQNNTVRRVNSDNTVTVSSDTIYGDAAGVVGDKLFKIYNNKVQFTTGDPLVASSWLPQSPNEYVCPGKDPYQVIDYGGTPYICCINGIWALTSQYEFKNQAPFMETAPHKETAYSFGARWGVTHGGYIMMPYNGALAVIGYGTAAVIDSAREGGQIYIQRLIPYGAKLLALTTNNIFVGYSVPAKPIWRREHQPPTNMTNIIGFIENDQLIVFGSGTTKVVEYSSIGLAQALITKTNVIPAKTPTALSRATGVSAIGKSFVDVTVYYAPNVSVPAYLSMSVTEFQHKTAQFNTHSNSARMFNKVTITFASLMECWLEGISWEPNVETVTAVIAADDASRVDGRLVGLSRGQMEWLFRDWLGKGTILELELDDYMHRYDKNSVTPAGPMRCIVRKVMTVNNATGPGNTRQAESTYSGDRLQVQFLRLKENTVHA